MTAPETMQGAVEQIYRFLKVGEIAQDGDEFVDDDCRSWSPIDRWAIGHPIARIYRTIRRRVSFPVAGSKQVRREAAEDALAWAVQKWQTEVANRPLVNVHRRSLDTTWRKVIRHFGGDDEVLCGPRHDDLLANGPDRLRASTDTTGGSA